MTTTGFRYSRTVLGSDVLHRPRLVSLLAQRFERRVTVVSAAAGFGKSTALTLAVDNNLIEPQGHDVWLAAVAADDDPQHLFSGLAEALDVEPVGTCDQLRQRIVDALWHRAPEEVCLVIDDSHLLRSESVRGEVRLLIDALPGNGHVLLAGRPGQSWPLAKWRASDQVLDITETDLQLDDGELAALRSRHDGHDRHDDVSRAAPGANGNGQAAEIDLPRHAASARLRLLAGEQASADFLWEEVLSPIEPDRLQDLAALSVLDEFDDVLVGALTDGRFTAETLVAEVPLVATQASGSRRLHALLRRALDRHLSDGKRRKTLSLAGDVERSRARFAQAIVLFERAGDPISVHETARDLIQRPLLRLSIADLLVARRAVGDIDPSGPVMACLHAQYLWIAAAGASAGLVHDTLPACEHSAELARAAGDVELEATQLYMAIQLRMLEQLPADDALLTRLAELAESHPHAHLMWAVCAAGLRRRSGDATGALAVLEPFRTHPSADAQVVLTTEYADLGRPEMVGIGLTAADVPSDLPNAELMSSFAMWLRGEAEPELADLVVSAATPEVIRRGFDVASLSMLGVGAIIAVMAGDRDSARRRVEQARPLAESGIAKSVELFYNAANAVLTAELGDEEGAAELLAPGVTGVSLDEFPERPHLMVLSLLYVVRPDARPMLDRVEFGPSLTAAVDAGRAVLAARAGDLAPAAALPWESAAVLRANVLPRHLVELACAAMLAGSSSTRQAASDLLDRLPHAGEHLAALTKHPHRPLAALAKQHGGNLARTAPYQLHTTLLGRVALQRDGEPLTGTDFDRRAKVRELWAYLVEHRECLRADVVAALWPEADDDAKAFGNLRSALATLQRVLEPDRASDAAPYFLRTDGDRLTLDASITSDVQQFERLVADARDADASGVPARTRALHQLAANLYAGDYLEFIDAGWATLTRLRLQALAVASMCRVAELTAAQGQPEEALGWARRALAVDPYCERALVTMLGTMHAAGAGSSARGVADDALARFADAGLTAGPALLRAISRLT